MRGAVWLAAASTALILSACTAKPDFAYEPGVCYAVTAEPGKAPTYNVVARDQAQIELCAARLEEMRLRFLRLGGTQQDVIGAYQGRYLFIDREGVKFGKSLTGSRFFAMARTGDGRLAIPGAILRDDTGRPVAVAAGADDK